MFESFITNNSAQDIASYLVISMIIFGLSPYGAFVVRYWLYLAFGTPRPRLVRTPRKTASQHLVDITASATARIDEMQDYIIELEALVQSAQVDVDTLEMENEALKEHIRAMEAGAKMQDSDDAQSGSTSDRAFDLMGLRTGASWDKVRTAYRELVKRHHPDHGGDAELFREITAAYDCLRTLYGM